VQGISSGFEGVHGESRSAGHAGVLGINNNGGMGVSASSNANHGVHGQTQSQSVGHAGVYGINSGQGPGVYGSSTNWDGVHGDSSAAGHAGVSGVNQAGGIGVYGASTGNAGQFMGAVLITGNLTVNGDVFLPGADCAEQFDLVGAQSLEPGTVVVIDSGGALRESMHAYDKKVAGVVSGAGEYKPSIVLDRSARSDRVPVALVGKVYCKVDAQFCPIEVGDLLTTSPTPGHAMKADDPRKAFGAIIGKALRPVAEGQGLVPILVALQ
jgi:hypothetical protein